MIPRKQYMANEASWEDYYAQFSNQMIVEYLDQELGDRIRASSDPNFFNDIPLGRWDRLSHSWPSVIDAINENMGWFPTMSDWTSVYKAAARQIYRAQFNNQEQQS